MKISIKHIVLLISVVTGIILLILFYNNGDTLVYFKTAKNKNIITLHKKLLSRGYDAKIIQNTIRIKNTENIATINEMLIQEGVIDAKIDKSNIFKILGKNRLRYSIDFQGGVKIWLTPNFNEIEKKFNIKISSYDKDKILKDFYNRIFNHINSKFGIINPKIYLAGNTIAIETKGAILIFKNSLFVQYSKKYTIDNKQILVSIKISKQKTFRPTEDLQFIRILLLGLIIIFIIFTISFLISYKLKGFILFVFFLNEIIYTIILMSLLRIEMYKMSLFSLIISFLIYFFSLNNIKMMKQNIKWKSIDRNLFFIIMMFSSTIIYLLQIHYLYSFALIQIISSSIGIIFNILKIKFFETTTQNFR